MTSTQRATKQSLLALLIALACLSAVLGATAFTSTLPAFADNATSNNTSATTATASAAASTAASDAREVKFLFTQDIHSFMDPTTGYANGTIREYGGASRLATLLAQNTNANTIYVDSGDFSQGTLLQAGFLNKAYELRTLGKLGCAVTTLGNHEWDYKGTGLATMLRSAMASGDPLPQLVMSNLDFSGTLTDEQKDVQAALAEYGAKTYTIITVNGVRVAFFGLSGKSSISNSPTSGMKWTDYIEAAQATVKEIGTQADIIVCLSHCGNKGDGETGEDFDLMKEVPEIDIVFSGHSHSRYQNAVVKDGTILASSGEYLQYMGSLTISVSADNKVTCTNYQLIPVDETVAINAATQATMESYKADITSTYLQTYAPGSAFDQVIAQSPYNFASVSEMYATHQEYPLGDLIADSYLYEATRNGVNDIDVALVGLGTVRSSITQGTITTADAFNICSLGVGGDGSAGHPLVTAYITGKELKLLTELDASLGTLVSDIKMSYAGLSYTFNDARMLLDRVTDIKLVRADGTTEVIDDDKLYKVCFNMYAGNMLGMLNGLTNGLLSIVLKNADGTEVTDLYACSLYEKNGTEMKEWVAFRNYLQSFDQVDGISTIPAKYADMQNRKIKVTEHGLAAIANPGPATIIAGVLIVVFVLLIVLIVRLIRKIHRKRKAKRAAKRAAAQAQAAGEDAEQQESSPEAPKAQTISEAVEAAAAQATREDNKA